MFRLVSFSQAATTIGIGTLSLAAFLSGLFLVFGSNATEAKEPLGQMWSTSQLKSMDDIDHSEYSRLLQKYVDQDGYVNYTKWKSTSKDRRALQHYLMDLSQASTTNTSSRSAQLAFWINAYNAVTLEGILQVYPTRSIRDHTSKFGGYNIWKDLSLTVGNKEFNLDSIEHKVLRKMGEPRIHFVIVCASIGCPRLLNEAYTAEKLEKQLTANTRDFFTRSKNLKIDSSNRTIYFSSILDWFGSDFGRTMPQRLEFLAPYLPQFAAKLAKSSDVRVKYLNYNWNLNDAKTK